MATKEEISVSTNEARSKALKLAIEKIEKDFGKGSIMKLGDKPAVNVETIPTGALALDIALGVGGIPRGRIIEIYGPESSGKTTLAQHIVAECQKKGGIAAFVDAEHALDPEYARNLGVNMTYNGKKMIEDENFKDKRFVITGSFDNISRDEIKEFIEERGGLTSDSVSKKTDVVLVGEAPGSKRDKAIELNIPIWNQAKLFEIMGIVEK